MNPFCRERVPSKPIFGGTYIGPPIVVNQNIPIGTQQLPANAQPQELKVPVIYSRNEPLVYEQQMRNYPANLDNIRRGVMTQDGGYDDPDISIMSLIDRHTKEKPGVRLLKKVKRNEKRRLAYAASKKK